MWYLCDQYDRVNNVCKYEVDRCNTGLEDRKTVSSDAQFMRYDHLKKKLCHHEEGPSLFQVELQDRNFASFSSQKHRFRDMTV